MTKAKILIELQCTECLGEGKAYITPTKALEPTRIVTCSECDGTGYEEQKISLDTLKHLLDGGSL